MWSVPTLLMVLAITLAFGKGFWQVFLAIGLTMWVEVARIVRGQFLSLREMPYVQAAEALGLPSWRIMWRHMLPNAIGPLVVVCAANFAAAILIEVTPQNERLIGFGYRYVMVSKQGEDGVISSKIKRRRY